MSLLSLPRDLQFELLLASDIPTIGRYCQISPIINQICSHERFWEQKFKQLTNDEPISPIILQLGTTWRERTEYFWRLLNPTIIYTLHKVLATHKRGEHTILGNFRVNSFEQAHLCLLELYRNRVEPFYSYFNATIEDLQEEYEKEWYNFEIVDVDSLIKLFSESELLGQHYQFNPNYLFTLGAENKMYNVIKSDVLFTVMGDMSDIYIGSAIILNYRELFRDAIQSTSEKVLINGSIEEIQPYEIKRIILNLHGYLYLFDYTANDVERMLNNSKSFMIKSGKIYCRERGPIYGAFPCHPT